MPLIAGRVLFSKGTTVGYTPGEITWDSTNLMMRVGSVVGAPAYYGLEICPTNTYNAIRMSGLISTAQGTPIISFGNTSDSYFGHIVYFSGSYSYLGITTAQNNFYIPSVLGNVYLKTNANLYSMCVTPVIPVTSPKGLVTIWSLSSGLVYSDSQGRLNNVASDVRLKKKVSKITDALTLVKTMQAVTFSWKKDGEKKEEIGLIAQQVPKQTCLVGKTKDGFSSVQYNKLSVLLLEALKQLITLRKV
jgi:hypothetical protein